MRKLRLRQDRNLAGGGVLTETMGKVNTKLNLETGEWQQRMGHADLRLGCSTLPPLPDHPSTALCAQLAGRHSPQDPQLWGQSLSQPQGRGIPQSIVAQSVRRTGREMSMGSLLRIPTLLCSEGGSGPGVLGEPHLDRYSHDLLQAPAMGERLC